MKRKEKWIVKESDSRPAGKNDECYYCNEKMGEEHKKDCVLRTRTVVVMVEFTTVYKVPESWDEYMIERYIQDSNCSSNNVRRLSEIEERMEEKNKCFCGYVRSKYLREATLEDEECFETYVEEDYE